MITPMEIHNKEFKKAIRGFNIAEVDEFLDKVVSDFEKLYRENGEMKDKMSVYNDRIESYTNMEKTLQSTLIVAQTTADEVVATARKKAELIVKEAEDQAQKIIADANNSIVNLNREYEELKKEVQVFKTRFKTLLEAELEALSANTKDI